MPPKKNLKLSAVRLPACAEASAGRRRLFREKIIVEKEKFLIINL